MFGSSSMCRGAIVPWAWPPAEGSTPAITMSGPWRGLDVMNAAVQAPFVAPLLELSGRVRPGLGTGLTSLFTQTPSAPWGVDSAHEEVEGPSRPGIVIRLMPLSAQTPLTAHEEEVGP